MRYNFIINKLIETDFLNRKNEWKNYLIIASSFYPPGEDFLVDKANIAKNIHFLVHGERPGEKRSKGDASVYVVDPDTDA